MAPAMSIAELAAYEKFFATTAGAAINASIRPPYDTAGLRDVFTGDWWEGTRFKSVYYRTDRLNAKGGLVRYTLTSTGPLYSLPRSAGRNAAIAFMRFQGKGKSDEGGNRRDGLILLVQNQGSSTWKAASLIGVPYVDQLPEAAGAPRPPTDSEETQARSFVESVIDYLEDGTVPSDAKMGPEPYDWRQAIKRGLWDSDSDVDVSLLDTGVAGVGAGAPITIVPAADGLIGVAQLVRTMTTPIYGGIHGEGNTDVLYRKRLVDGRIRTRDGLSIAFTIRDGGEPAVIGGDLGLFLPK